MKRNIEIWTILKLKFTQKSLYNSTIIDVIIVNFIKELEYFL
jgi:hypothetical protein